jgi:predicted acyl esterase
MTLMRRVTALIGLAGALAFAPAAQAAVPAVFNQSTAVPITCTPNPADGVRECAGTVPTFDGVPIDVNVALPPEPASSPDGPYPLVMAFHGWGGSKIPFGTAGTSEGLRRWTSQGYAAFSMTDRGWGNSCGPGSPSLADPNCAHGYIRLMDTRYEVRDAQILAGMLVDDGVADPQRIGAIGPSYGGGLAMSLAALNNRVMAPDGTLGPWTSANGTPLLIAAAVPEIPWTDLAYALAPNGSTLDYTVDNAYGSTTGVMKQSLVGTLYAIGQASGNYAAPGADPNADLTSWFGRMSAGEPYAGDPTLSHMIEELTAHHSSYYLHDSVAPAPLFISSGWTDDLFPPDEALRFYNRTRTHHPGADLSLFFADYGHRRGQNKSDDVARLRAGQNAWFAHFLAGGPAPFEGVTALTTTCPGTAPSAGPYTAPSWPELAPGEVRLESAEAQTIVPGAGNPGIGQTFDPIGGGGACAQVTGTDQPGVASYRLPPARRGGFTLMGSPTVIAGINSHGPHSQIASRLLDVGPDGKETLVARGIYRVPQGGGTRVFQLHPNAWGFRTGHVAKLELLPDDRPYSRPTDGQKLITVSTLELRLPVAERPGAGGGTVASPKPRVVPPGATLAPGFTTSGARAQLAPGPPRVRGDTLVLRISCPAEFTGCHRGRVVVRGAPAKARNPRRLVSGRFLVAEGGFTARGGQTKTVRLPLTPVARAYFAQHHTLRTVITVSSAESAAADQRFRVPRRTG